MNQGVKLQYIGNGFYLVSECSARILGRSGATPGQTALPKPGMERRVQVGEIDYWLTRTRYNGKTRWAIHN